MPCAAKETAPPAVTLRSRKDVTSKSAIVSASETPIAALEPVADPSAVV